MIWRLVLFWALLIGDGWSQDASVPSSRSRVVWIERPTVVNKFAVDSDGVRSMFVSALQVFTEEKNLGAAWKKLGVVPSDVVGIKINASMGAVMGTRPSLVNAVVETLEAAGVPPQHIYIWDKFGNDLEKAGWLPQSGADWPAVRSVIPDTGFDGQQFYANEILGRLIWGDLLFRGKKPSREDLLKMAETVAKKPGDGADPGVKKPGDPAETKKQMDVEDQTSNRSYFATLVTQTFTKIINIPVMADHVDWGINGCISSLAIGSVDNSRRFADENYEGDLAIPEILDRDLFRKKVVLHIMDGLIAQFAGGPQFVPLYTQGIGALYLSNDPVAIDSLVLPRLEEWRRAALVVPIGDQARHVKAAAQIGLGHNTPKDIELLRVQ